MLVSLFFHLKAYEKRNLARSFFILKELHVIGLTTRQNRLVSNSNAKLARSIVEISGPARVRVSSNQTSLVRVISGRNGRSY